MKVEVGWDYIRLSGKSDSERALLKAWRDSIPRITGCGRSDGKGFLTLTFAGDRRQEAYHYHCGICGRDCSKAFTCLKCQKLFCQECGEVLEYRTLDEVICHALCREHYNDLVLKLPEIYGT